MPENENHQGDEKLLILPLGEESKKITQVISNDTARQILELLADAPLCASDIAQRLQAPLTTITYNLENLESVGLIKVEKIKYSEKGREVKIYAPVRKLIVLVPEKTDRKSVVDMLRKYMGVIMAAVLASSFIEFLARSVSSSTKMVQTYDYSFKENSLNETLTGADVGNLVPTPVNTSLAKSAPMVTPEPTAVLIAESVPAATSPPIVPSPVYSGNASATATPIHIQPLIDNGAASQAALDIFTNLANTISAHPGLVFFLGCMFVIALFIIMDYRRKSKKQ
jgi:DNA-binding transcriptional ArsR family regulator